MVELTKLNKKTFFLNSDLVETIESTPDTVITLRNGKLVLVLETPEMVVDRITTFKRKLSGLQ